MRYLGGKSKHAKSILYIVLRNRKPGQWYVEPFVGGGAVIECVKGNRIGADLNPYAIQALISIRDNIDELPKNNTEFTEDDYKKLRLDDSYKHKGYAGLAFSFSGKWLGGYAKDNQCVDYVAKAYKSAVTQSHRLAGVELLCCSYKDLPVPPNSLIYCDPPYAGTTGYSTGAFNHDEFWDWCRKMAAAGHDVFVSEYGAPGDFACVYTKPAANSVTLDKTKIKTAYEKLYVHESQLGKTLYQYDMFGAA